MEFKDKVEYSIEDWKLYEEDEDISIALAKVEFLSDKPNSHKHVYTIDVIKQYAPTFLGKFVVADYDKYKNDVTGHTSNQNIVGYIPVAQEVSYEQKEDGYWYASVEVAISKIYAPEVYALFKESNYRAVSVEELVGFAEGEENLKDGVDEKHIVGFEGVGITILGKSVNPSIEGANIKITRMSEDSIKDMESEYVKYTQKSSNVETISMNEIMAKLENIEKKLSKEEVMQDNTEVVLDAQVEEMSVEQPEAEVVEETMAEVVEEQLSDENVEEMACGGSSEDKKSEEEEYAEDESEDEESEDESKKAEEKLAELENLLAECNEKISLYEAELSELRAYKENAQSTEKDTIITETLSQAKDYCDEQTYNKFKTSGEACEYANINGWRNEVLASISVNLMAKMSEITSKEEGVLEMGMPIQTETQKESIYD